MAVIMQMARGALELGRHRLDSGRTDDGMRVLRQLIGLSHSPRPTSAEACFLLGRTHLVRSEFTEAREHLAKAVRLEPNNAEYHFHYAQALEQDDNGCELLANQHYSLAYRLSPNDAEKNCAYALRLATTRNLEMGLRLLELAYERHTGNAMVVEAFLEGLIGAERYDDAELVLTQTAYRHSNCQQCRALIHRYRQRLAAESTKRWPKPHGSDGANVLTFRNFSALDSENNACQTADVKKHRIAEIAAKRRSRASRRKPLPDTSSIRLDFGRSKTMRKGKLQR